MPENASNGKSKNPQKNTEGDLKDKKVVEIAINEDDRRSEHHLVLRLLKSEDYPDLKEIMDLIYPRLGAWEKKAFEAQLNRFAEGQICIEDNGKVTAAAISVIIDYNKFGDKHTYKDITGNGYLTTHNKKGDTLYGVDIFVHPEYRDMRLGRRLYDARKQLCERLNLRRIIIGGRLPDFHKYSEEMSIHEYIRRVKNTELFDPVLTFQLANDFHIRRVVRNYLPGDHESRSYAALLEWNNIYYETPVEAGKFMGVTKTVVRIGVVQWQMRRLNSLDDLHAQLEYFVDAVSGYQSDFVLFPEFFSGPLMAKFNDESPSGAIRRLADYTEPIRDFFIEMALSYNINIICGSMPYVKDEILHNVSFLCRRDGTWDVQYKLHVTPDEKSYWGLRGGNRLSVFETDVGKIGILICYDVEFPELSRILAEQGMDILFVPYWTDTKNAYLRVRRCAQARAIENECFVAMAGSVGNLPLVENMDIQYSQSAVFSPSDFAFPHDAVVAEATPNTEMTLVSDLDLSLLKELRHQGSVTNLKDRRDDLYTIKYKF